MVGCPPRYIGHCTKVHCHERAVTFQANLFFFCLTPILIKTFPFVPSFLIPSNFPNLSQNKTDTNTTTMRILAALLLSCTASATHRTVQYSHPDDELAAREVRRYVYLRTGEHPPLDSEDPLTTPLLERIVIEAREDAGHEVAVEDGAQRVIRIRGKTVEDRLHGAYTFAQQLGVRFGSSGDRVPPRRLPADTPLPVYAQNLADPMFTSRGLQPFHDFPEGPDWWNGNQYKSVVSQVSKMRMNFIGLHTYPYAKQQATAKNEPTVFVGTKDDINDDGTVKPASSYVTSYANTMRAFWGHEPVPTSNYSWGSSEIFPTDCWSPVQKESICPFPTTPDSAAQFFDDITDMLEDAFSYAKTIGVDSCVGTETPLSAPKANTSYDYYTGMFTRLQKRMPSLSYYWVWTPEAWEWGNMNSSNPIFTDAIKDLDAAMQAKKDLNATFKMTTNGWVVGPLPDRSIFDKELSTDWDAITSIDLNTGHSAVDPSYAQITRHAKWVIPWMEDDPDMSAPQLWVERTLQHMEDAQKYGCTGLLGIHWRTKIVSPQIEAMAAKSWNASLQSEDFWQDWAVSQFGSIVASEAASVFISVDSTKMPIVESWDNGPGMMKPSLTQCNSTPFAFADRLAALTNKTGNPAHEENLRYWVETFLFMKAMAATECVWYYFNDAMKAVAQAPTPEGQRQLAIKIAVPQREQLVANCTQMMTHMLNTVSTPGELGTLMNLETRSMWQALELPGRTLLKYLQLPALPANLTAPKAFTGTHRIVVPTVRTAMTKQEGSVDLDVLFLSDKPADGLQIFTRCSGATAWEGTAATHVSRQVYKVSVPTPQCDFEWYLGEAAGGLVYPVGGADSPVTVVRA